MVDFAGWDMPVQYESIVVEHGATRSGIGLFDISHMGRLRFDGPDAAKFLDRLLTRAVLPMKTGDIRYSLMTHDEGGVLDDVLVYRLDDGDGEYYLLVVNASNREKIVRWIERHGSEKEEVTVRDLTLDTAMIAVQGPHAVSLGQSFCQPAVAELKYFTGQHGRLRGADNVEALISRTGYTGEDGFELILDAKAAVPVWEALLAAGADDGARAIGLGARDTLRLEAAMPLYGHELSETINPLEAGLKFAVQLKDRDFIGSDALRSVRANGVSRRRIGLTLEGRRAPREGYEVFDNDDNRVGVVTSGAYSPTLNHSIAMALVDAAAADHEQLQVDIRGKRFDCRVASLPFYSRPQQS